MSETTAVGPRSRRTHKKSRSGCDNCKRRRIKAVAAAMLDVLGKLACFNPWRRARLPSLSDGTDSSTDSLQCDEKRPACSNCVNHEIECTFTKIRGLDSASPLASVETKSAPRRYRFRSYQYLPGGQRRVAKPSPVENSGPRQASTESTGAEEDPTTTTTSTTTAEDSLPGGISIADLELFHHFTITVYRTIAEPGMQEVWQNDIVKWSFGFPSILHLILALSALHLSHEQPAMQDWYVQQADRHFTFGVRSVTTVISQLDVESCHKVYMAAVLICFVYFGRGPRPGEYLIFSDSGPAEWIVLMHGVKLILQSYQDRIFSGVLKPKLGPPVHGINPSRRGEFQDHVTHVQALRELVEQEMADEADRVMYISVTNKLLDTVDELFTKISAQKLRVGLLQVIIGWLYRLPGEFVKRLEQKEPLALVILAHWAMLLKYMRQVWFMKGWDEHVLSGIRTFLPADFQRWIEWPLLVGERQSELDLE